MSGCEQSLGGALGALMAPILGNGAVALAAEVESAVSAGEHLGLTEPEAREVIEAWSEAYAQTKHPLSWLEVRTAMARRATGEEWRP